MSIYPATFTKKVLPGFLIVKVAKPQMVFLDSAHTANISVVKITLFNCVRVSTVILL